MRLALPVLLAPLLLAACDPTGGADSGTGDCAHPMAVITDIDETLTTDDNEFLHQIVDPDYDPEMRPDANTLMVTYAALGYRIFYVTARGDDLFLLDGTSATDATTHWLDAHGFPRSDGDTFLANGVGAFSSAAADYKTGVVTDLQDAGWDFVYSYGNADSDITAYQAAGLPEDTMFLVGDLAGTISGTVPVPTSDAYTNHYADWMSGVPAATCGG